MTLLLVGLTDYVLEQASLLLLVAHRAQDLLQPYQALQNALVIILVLRDFD